MLSVCKMQRPLLPKQIKADLYNLHSSLDAWYILCVLHLHNSISTFWQWRTCRRTSCVCHMMPGQGMQVALTARMHIKNPPLTLTCVVPVVM